MGRLRMGGWYRRIRLAGFRNWSKMWRPEEYYIHFQEANELAGVEIQRYVDGTYAETVGDPLVTDENGKASIKLDWGTYYYRATIDDYMPKDFVITMPTYHKPRLFEMIPGHVVTFEEQGDEDDVAIDIYSDVELTQLVDSIDTADGGSAEIMLPDGEYYYIASKEGFADEVGTFEVDGAIVTEEFTMEPLFTVTFDEQNDLEGVKIEIFEDDQRESLIATVYTDENGEVEIDLTADTYYYTASFEDYEDEEDDFEVVDAPITEEFTMVQNAYTVSLSGYPEIEADGTDAGGSFAATLDKEIESVPIKFELEDFIAGDIDAALHVETSDPVSVEDLVGVGIDLGTDEDGKATLQITFAAEVDKSGNLVASIDDGHALVAESDSDTLLLQVDTTTKG